tara:strand:+ start:651 stop:827 length:177 start_codon:yes stop_codon:yes gene_type:complete
LSHASKILQNSVNISKASNGDITEEIIDHIVSKSAFQASVNVINANDEILGTLLDIKS